MKKNGKFEVRSSASARRQGYIGGSKTGRPNKSEININMGGLGHTGSPSSATKPAGWENSHMYNMMYNAIMKVLEKGVGSRGSST